MSTIKDVARLAGVGVGTASRVISGKGSVAPQTAERVRAAVEALGFRPSTIARALSRRLLDMLGLYVPNFEGSFYSQVMATVDAELRAVARHMVVANGCGDDQCRRMTQDAIDFLQQRECDGLIVVSNDLAEEDLRALYGHQPLLSVLNRQVPGLEAVCFSSDHAEGGRLAAACVLQHGHRRVALIAGPEEAPDNRARVQAFCATLAEAGCPVPEAARLPGNFTFDSGAAAATELLRRQSALPPGERATVLFCANDLMAVGAMGVLQRAGLRVPQDLSVLGYDDADIAVHTWPALSTVRIPIDAVARAGTRDLLNRCYGLALEVQRDFAPAVVLRESLARPSGSRPHP